MPTESTPDPVSQLEHDHVHMSQLVDDLRGLVNAADLNALSADQHTLLLDTLTALHDDLLVHFAQEEEGLFPFSLAICQTRGQRIAQILATHDGLCGSVGRMLSIAQRGLEHFNTSRAAFAALFRRFDESYVSHARDECAFLRSLHPRLDNDRRNQLLQLLDELLPLRTVWVRCRRESLSPSLSPPVHRRIGSAPLPSWA
ncbi:MAG: hemerythrin domain-containing protein [Polyangiaceae bacterium]